MQDRERMSVCYKRAKVFLVEIATSNNLNKVELEKYFNIEKTFKTKEDILFGLLKSAQNYNMMKNVIGLDNVEKKDKFKEILYNYNADDILSNYNSNDLYETFCDKFIIKNKESKSNCWRRYSNAVISAAEYINKFKTAEDFDKYVCDASPNSAASSDLPKTIGKEVVGIRFATACNFLKELGYSGYTKPDVHIKDIFNELDFCKENEYKVFDSVVEMANICNETPYNVDKTFWLICSGNFYLHDMKVQGKKAEFIDKMSRLI